MSTDTFKPMTQKDRYFVLFYGSVCIGALAYLSYLKNRQERQVEFFNELETKVANAKIGALLNGRPNSNRCGVTFADPGSDSPADISIISKHSIDCPGCGEIFYKITGQSLALAARGGTGIRGLVPHPKKESSVNVESKPTTNDDNDGAS